jgi:hypothetical protein
MNNVEEESEPLMIANGREEWRESLGGRKKKDIGE